MSFQEVLDYMYRALPMYQRVGASAYKKGLDNIFTLCERLGNPQRKFRSVHVGGTNGKGSTSHMLAAIMNKSGYKTGLYTSPHLKSFTERIKINGSEIAQEAVTEFVSRNKKLLDEVSPSFFEMTVALAFEYFAREQVDIAIVEVGLGGRLDSTNIIDPLLSVITNISFDHQAMLGNTLPEIAGEKAGIIKKNTPVVISEKGTQEVNEVFLRKAAVEHAPIFFAEDYLSIVKVELEGTKPCFNIVENSKLIYEKLVLELGGFYQRKNLLGVLKAIELLEKQGFVISESSLRKGLSEFASLTGLKGRWQKIGEAPLIFCDTAHNESGIGTIVDQLKTVPHDDLFIVYGTVNDKDLSKIIPLLPRQAFYYFCEPSVPRALPAYELMHKVQGFGFKGVVIPDVNEALQQAKEAAGPQDLILVVGSTFVVAEVNDL